MLRPLEHLCAPSGLDGSHGAFRLPGSELKLPVSNDVDAIQLWLMDIENPESRRSLRSAPEKLLNWSWWVRAKALSSLTADDLLQFQAFLKSPPASWLSRKGTPRSSPDWTPFNCPARDAHVSTVMNGLGSLFNWMRDVGYADVRLATQYRVRSFGAVPARGSRNPVPDEPFTKLHFRDVRYFEAALGGFRCRNPLHMRLLFELQFYGCLDAAEVSRLRFCDLEVPEDDDGLPTLRILERQPTRSLLYALPPLEQTLRAWSLSQNQLSGAPDTIFLGYGAGDIRKSSARLIAYAAEEAELAGDWQAHERLKLFRSGDLRHALIDALPAQLRTAAWEALGASIVADHRTAVRRLPDRVFLTEGDLRASMAAIMAAIQDGADSKSID